MKRIRASAIAAVIVLSGIAGACAVAPAAAQETPRAGGVIRVGLAAEPESLDPHVSHEPYGLRVRNHVFEGLVTWDEHMNPVPGLAEGWKGSDDGKQYSFVLRKGVKFHNGQELTADDVKYSLDRVRKVSARRGDFRVIADVRVVDRYTVLVTLSEATPTFIPALSQWWPMILPKDATEAQLQQHKQLAQPIGTGPYRFVEWKRGQHIRLERFKEYAGRTEPSSGYFGRKVAYADELLFIPMRESVVRILALEKGDIDYADLIPLEEVNRLKRVPNVVVAVSPGTSWSGLYFNVKVEPFNRLEMRQAVAHAIDYKGVIDQVFQSYARQNQSPVALVQKKWRTPAHDRTHRHDPALARELVRKAGYDGRPLVLEAINTGYDRATAEVLEAQLRAVGINVELRIQDLAAQMASIYARTRHGAVPKWHMSLLVGSAFRPDPHFHFGIRVYGKEHVGWYENPRLDGLIEEAARSLDDARRPRLYDDIQNIVMDEVPMVVLNHYDLVDAYRSHLRGVRVIDPLADMFWNVWIAR